MNNKITRIFFTVLLIFPTVVYASTAASGSFTAAQACEAYVSKNKRSNPDDTRLQAGVSYPVFEVNKPSHPDWYHIRVASASPAERWVAKSCGRADVELGGGSGGGGSGNVCHSPGQQDSFVLALSWQPAFCEIHRSKPECHIDDAKSYQAHNFTLHGLWPNKKSCGTGFGFCGEPRSKPGNFCDYPALSLLSKTRSSLEQVMPSAVAGSCLQRHEWFKHGTCQVGWSVDEYFETAINLTLQFNESGIANFISGNLGKTVSEADFITSLDGAHGKGAHQSIELKCQNGNLVDVYISLPATIAANDSLGSMMHKARGRFKSSCGGKFRVDPIGFE